MAHCKDYKAFWCSGLTNRRVRYMGFNSLGGHDHFESKSPFLARGPGQGLSPLGGGDLPLRATLAGGDFPWTEGSGRLHSGEPKPSDAYAGPGESGASRCITQ